MNEGDSNLLSVLIELQREGRSEQREEQRQLREEQRQHHAEQNKTNKEVAAALTEVAHQLKASNEKHSQTEKITEDHKNEIEWMKPVVKRSKKFQSRTDNVITKIIAAVCLGVVLFFVGAGVDRIVNTDKQEQTNGN